VTIDQLLRHTSGINDPPSSEGFYGPMLGKTPEGTARLVMDTTPQTKPGTKIAYSNRGYALLYLLGNKVTSGRLVGDGFAGFIKSEIFAPLGMDRSGFGGDFTKDCAPTSLDKDQSSVIKCWSQDRLVRGLGGKFGGNGGYEGTTVDVNKLVAAVLNDGMTPDGRRIWSHDSVAAFTTAIDTPTGQRRRGAGTMINYSRSFLGSLKAADWFHIGFNGTMALGCQSGATVTIAMNGTYKHLMDEKRKASVYNAFRVVDNDFLTNLQKK
jgi:CubicO group peptidase (beta-lactamase class C family)